MNKVVEILMRRDNLSYNEAVEAVKDCKEQLLTCDPYEASEVILEELGLEPDYLMDILEVDE